MHLFGFCFNVKKLYCCVQEELVRDNVAKFMEMSEDMERRHRHELVELRESYEGLSCYCSVVSTFLDIYCSPTSTWLVKS